MILNTKQNILSLRRGQLTRKKNMKVLGVVVFILRLYSILLIVHVQYNEIHSIFFIVLVQLVGLINQAIL